jgi:predicted RNA-binding protein YlqC (UPF0109 family)
MSMEERGADLRELVEYMARSLVDRPESVRVSQVRGGQTTIIKLTVAPEDKGWVIGRRGRVANAMRALLKVAASESGDRRVMLEIT